MPACGVLVGGPSGDHDQRIGEVSGHGLFAKFVAHPPAEVLHETVLHRLSQRDVLPFDDELFAPLLDRVRGQFRHIVRYDHPRLAASVGQ
jgi:hypothetical protein